MHTIEEVRKEASYVALDRTREMLLAYADLLEAMEVCSGETTPIQRDFVAALRQRVAAKQKARKG